MSENRGTLHDVAVSIDDFTALARAWMRRTLIAQAVVLAVVATLCCGVYWLIWEAQRVSQHLDGAILRLDDLEQAQRALRESSEQMRTSVQNDIADRPSVEIRPEPSPAGKPRAVVVIKPPANAPRGAPSAVTIPLAVPTAHLE